MQTINCPNCNGENDLDERNLCQHCGFNISDYKRRKKLKEDWEIFVYRNNEEERLRIQRELSIEYQQSESIKNISKEINNNVKYLKKSEKIIWISLLFVAVFLYLIDITDIPQKSVLWYICTIAAVLCFIPIPIFAASILDVNKANKKLNEELILAKNDYKAYITLIKSRAKNTNLPSQATKS